MSLRRRRKSSASTRRSQEKERKQEPVEAPDKQHVHMSTDERLIARLRRMQLPEPPPGVRQRSLERYREWLSSQQGRNRYRDD